jgi:hypothetical protein
MDSAHPLDCFWERSGRNMSEAVELQYRPCMPLHYADPHEKHSRWYTAVENFNRSRPGQFLARHFWPRIDPWLYRATGGRYPWILGMVSTAPLMTTGAKSGQPREHQITKSRTSTMDPIPS